MAYTLLTSDRSPFGRICRMLMLHYKIPFELRAVNFLEDRNAAAILAEETPINKVPVLIVDGQKLFDSRVIVNYLTRQHSLPELPFNEENIVSAIYSVLDTSVAFFLLRHDGFPAETPGNFFRRNRERIPANLHYLEPWAVKLDPGRERDWNYASMSLYSCVDWVERRAQTANFADYPALAEFKRKFANHPGVKETTF